MPNTANNVMPLSARSLGSKVGLFTSRISNLGSSSQRNNNDLRAVYPKKEEKDFITAT